MFKKNLQLVNYLNKFVPELILLLDILNFLTKLFSSNKTTSSFRVPLVLVPAKPHVNKTLPIVSGVRADYSNCPITTILYLFFLKYLIFVGATSLNRVKTTSNIIFTITF